MDYGDWSFVQCHHADWNLVEDAHIAGSDDGLRNVDRGTQTGAPPRRRRKIVFS